MSLPGTSDASGPSDAPQPPDADLAPVPPRLQVLVTGMAMGAADVVPGFSGGTVALVAGVYPRLVANVRASAHVVSLLLRLRLRDLPAAIRALDWGFLALLLSGLVAAAFTLASGLERLLETEPITMSAVFLGLVLGAAYVARHQLRGAATSRLLLIGVVSAAITAPLLGLRPGSLADPSLLFLAAAAAIGVCAMILPGVSGAFLLLVLGAYEPVIAAIAARDLVTIGVVIGGAVAGLLAFSTLLHWLLRRAHDVVLAVLIGLMVGSARVLWPWPSGTGVGDPTIAAPSGPVLVPAAAGLAALVLVVVADLVLRRRAAAASA